MAGSIRHPRPTAAEVGRAREIDLRDRLAGMLRVDARRVFLAAGATSANATVLHFLARRARTSERRCRVKFPEYPPLYGTAAYLGLPPTDGDGRAAVALVSQPRNPEGRRWSWSELEDWAEPARHLVIDETFREFSGRASLASRGRARTWITGSFTKFFGADDLRVGYAVVPETEIEEFERYVGLVTDSLPKYSIAGALACLDALPRLRAEVRQITDRNIAVLRARLPAPALAAPLYFDRVDGVPGDEVARRCLAASVLVCPGSLFGDPSGVRVCLTRRSFPRDFAAYLGVRERLLDRPIRRNRAADRSIRARPPRGASGRARAAPA